MISQRLQALKEAPCCSSAYVYHADVTGLGNLHLLNLEHVCGMTELCMHMIALASCDHETCCVLSKQAGALHPYSSAADS